MPAVASAARKLARTGLAPVRVAEAVQAKSFVSHELVPAINIIREEGVAFGQLMGVFACMALWRSTSVIEQNLGRLSLVSEVGRRCRSRRHSLIVSV